MRFPIYVKYVVCLCRYLWLHKTVSFIAHDQMLRRKLINSLQRLKFIDILPNFKRYEKRMTARVLVRNVENEARIQISFKYPPLEDEVISGNGKQRMFNFDRAKSEELEKTLLRISANVSKEANKKAKKRKTEQGTPSSDVGVQLSRRDGLPIDGSLTNEQAWTHGLKLCIDDHSYDVHLNVSTIKQLSLPNVIISSFPVKPKIELEFCLPEDCRFTWFRQLVKASTSSGNAEGISKTNGKSSETEKNGKPKQSSKQNNNLEKVPWVEIHHGETYTPGKEDEGSLLKIDCVPSSQGVQGELMSSVSKFPVVPCAEYYPFEGRHKHTVKSAGPGRFRMMTYNILADLYADSDFTRDFLFPYCPEQALNIDYRKALIIREILDVICLQEVDKKVFDHDLEPELSAAGFTGLLKTKAGEVAEGVATFFRNSKFRFVASHDIILSVELLSDNDLYVDLKVKVSQSEALLEKISTRSSCLQVTVLECTEDSKRHILVATVHLYFHPKASHIRIIHTAVITRHIEKLLTQYQLEKGVRPDVIFCGDLNSWPRSGLHEYLTTKKVSGKHADFYSCGKPEYVEGMDLTHNLDLISACGTPHYTNYVSGFNECLDYIYHEPARTRVTSVVPMPTHEEVTENTALPSVLFPSDHIALVCDLEWV